MFNASGLCVFVLEMYRILMVCVYTITNVTSPKIVVVKDETHVVLLLALTDVSTVPSASIIRPGY